MVKALFQSAIGYHSRGQLAEAEAAYRRILQSQPRHFDALHMLGVIGLQVGRSDVAVDLIGQAVRLNGGHAEAWFNLGNALVNTGRIEDAFQAYEKAFLLRPGHLDTQINRANVLRELGRLDDAIAAFRAVLRKAPDDADVHFNLGTALISVLKLDEALASLREASRLRPDFAEALTNQCAVLRALKRPAEALDIGEQAVRCAPNYPEAHNQLGNVLADLGRAEEALARFDAAIALKPDFADVYSHRGSVLDDLARCHEAVASYDKALEIRPDFAQAHANRGNALRHLGQLDAALANYNTALAQDPTNPKAHLNKALLTLALGDLPTGFDLYEWRKKLRVMASPASPEWTGEQDLRGKTLLIQWEQGLGDTIQFCRYAHLAASLAGHVVMSVQTSLVALLRHAMPEIEIIGSDAPAPAFDYNVAMLSLPRALRTNLASIPAPVPYLSAPPDRAQAMAAHLGPKQRPRVGLVWNSGVRPDQPEDRFINARRDVPFALIASLNLPHVDFYSLQKGEPAESALPGLLSAHWQGGNFHNLAHLLTDFADTAALIDQLDLVISVDTSVAHLAGAMGKPVWIFNSFDTCWRWLLEREDSPWYPSARLFRQPTLGDWNSVIARVQLALSEHFPA